MTLSNFELALALSNFVGSALSALGSGFIILCYVFLPLKKHYRHRLILNLAIADFINALDNVVSGLVVLTTGSLSRNTSMYRQWFHRTAIGPSNSNHSVGSFKANRSLQATDTSIFAISIVTIMIVTASHRSSWSAKSKKSKENLIVVASSRLRKTTILAMSGNWCWLTPEPVYVRYVLTHGWHFMFIFTEIGMSLHNGFPDSQRALETPYTQHLKPAFQTQHHPSSAITLHYHDSQKQLSKILLLNAYPIAYIVLWIPGLCNRLVEASGRTSRVLQIMQASTQFIGFANSVDVWVE
ncbi:hypothetical protein F5146DRAFT_1156246 [Armillaria mellea]|nr:hypothetical protein F5146DRAFT_1156246 [Armillaria mellea]